MKKWILNWPGEKDQHMNICICYVYITITTAQLWWDMRRSIIYSCHHHRFQFFSSVSHHHCQLLSFSFVPPRHGQLTQLLICIITVATTSTWTRVLEEGHIFKINNKKFKNDGRGNSRNIILKKKYPHTLLFRCYNT